MKGFLIFFRLCIACSCSTGRVQKRPFLVLLLVSSSLHWPISNVIISYYNVKTKHKKAKDNKNTTASIFSLRTTSRSDAHVGCVYFWKKCISFQTTLVDDGLLWAMLCGWCWKFFVCWWGCICAAVTFRPNVVCVLCQRKLYRNVYRVNRDIKAARPYIVNHMCCVLVA